VNIFGTPGLGEFWHHSALNIFNSENYQNVLTVMFIFNVRSALFAVKCRGIECFRLLDINSILGRRILRSAHFRNAVIALATCQGRKTRGLVACMSVVRFDFEGFEPIDHG
jgi:hypothetical protein